LRHHLRCLFSNLSPDRWTRDRSRGEKLSIPFVIALQSRKTRYNLF
jgi:hypothetical protein